MTYVRKEKTDYLYKTTETNLAAVLIAVGFRLEASEANQYRKVSFAFEDSPELRDTVQGYFLRELQVEPQSVFDALRFIRSSIASTLES
jgi:hypothetical protein